MRASRHGGEGGGVDGVAIESCGGRTAEFKVDRSEEIVGKVGLAGPHSSNRASGGAAVRDFEVVHRKDSLHETRDLRPLFLEVGGERPSEFGKHDRVNKA